MNLAKNTPTQPTSIKAGTPNLVFSLSPPLSNLLPSPSHNAFLPLSLSLFYLSLSHTLTHQPQQWVFLPRSSGMGPGGASLPPLTVPCDCAKRRLRQHHNTLPTAPPKKGQRRQKGKRGKKKVRQRKAGELDKRTRRGLLWSGEIGKRTFLLRNFG